jgi:hypothetical protein
MRCVLRALKQEGAQIGAQRKKPADLAVAGEIQFKKSWRRQEE